MDNDDLDVEMQCPYKKIILETENGQIDVHNITNPENKSPESPQLEDKGKIFSDDHEYNVTDSTKFESMEEDVCNKSETEVESVSHFIQEPSCEKQNYSEGLKDFHILDEVQGDSDNEDGNDPNARIVIKNIQQGISF